MEQNRNPGRESPEPTPLPQGETALPPESGVGPLFPAPEPPGAALQRLPAVPVPATAPAAELDFEPVPLRHRDDGWTPERQRAFIEALADTLSVAAAAERVGMSESSAHRLRRRAGAKGFGAAWAAAFRQGIRDRVAPLAIDRAVNGTIKRIYYHGEMIAEERVYSDRLLLALLANADRFFPVAGEAQEMLRDWDGAMERLGSGALEGGGRLWEDGHGNWLTDYPPPEGFDGWEEGEPGQTAYQRTLTDEEAKALRAHAAGRGARAREARDRFFDSGNRRRRKYGRK